MAKFTLLPALALAVAIAGCGEIEPPRARVLDGEPIRVVATTGMIADVVATVGGDRVEVQALMGPGSTRTSTRRASTTSAHSSGPM